MNRLTNGIKNTTLRLSNPLLDNKAIAEMGVKLGGWGKNLDKTAKNITEITNIYLLIIFIKDDYVKIQRNNQSFC